LDCIFTDDGNLVEQVNYMTPMGKSDHVVLGWNITLMAQTHTHTHCVLMAIFPGEPGLAGCPLNSPSPFIPGLRILFGQT